MIVWFLLILIWTNAIEASHFNGGTVTWAPVYPSSNSSLILITITQSYSYVYPTVACTTNIPTIGANGNLTCVGNCSTENGFVNMTISILTDCTSFSASLGAVFSQRSVNISLIENTYFWIGNRGSAWRTLQNGAGGWSIVSLIDLERRPDGLINSPPVSQITSPQYAIFNETTTIYIPISDANPGDDLRCRWSKENSSTGVDECAAICTSASVLSLANLTGCTLTFTGTIPNVWYALAIQIEDFINTTSTTPMSSIPIQFLIYVSTPTCTQVPVIVPLSGCLEVQVNVSVTFTLYAMNYCNRTKVVVDALIAAESINGMSVSGLVNSTTNTSLVYVTLTWTPQTNQNGSQQFCAVAYTNEKVQSNPYCVTFYVTASAPCTTTTTSTVTTATTTTDTTTTATTTTSVTTTTETTTTVTTATTTTATTTTETTSTTESTTSETTTTTVTTTTTITTTTTTSDTSTTTITTTTTTSETTPTQTTTIPSSSNQLNIPLIVGLSMLALLLALCCSLCLLCCLKRNVFGSRRRQNKKKTALQQGGNTLSTKRDITKIQQSKKSQNHIINNELNTEKTLRRYSFGKPILTMPTSTINNERITSLNPAEVEKIKKSSKEEKASIKSHSQRNSDGNTTVVQKQSRSRRFSVAVSRIRRSSSVAETIKENESNKSTPLHHQENDIPISSSKIHVSRLPKNKVSSSFKIPDNTDSEQNVSRIRSQSAANNVNNNNTTAINIVDPKLSRASSINIVKQQENQTSSARTNRSIVVKVKSVQNNQIGHNDDNMMRKRASTFGGTSVTIKKTINKNSKSFANHPTNLTVLNDDIKPKTDHRVTVVRVKKEYS